MFLEIETKNKCREYQRTIEFEEQIKKKKYIISGDIYFMIKELVQSDGKNTEFIAGVIKGLVLAQGIQELNKIKE